MTVAARFYVQSVTPPPENSSQGTQVTLGAVCRGAANSAWASATPAGQIHMTIRNDLAAQQFIQGREYELTFTEVDPPKQGDGHSVQAVQLYGGTAWSCGVCGMYPQGQTYGVEADPATLDWSTHDQHFAS